MSLTNSLPPLKFNIAITSREQLHNLTFQELSTYRTQIDNDLSILFNYLQSNLHFDMDTPLISPDGYPRSDIDVVQVRLCRVKIIKLKNDYKWIGEELLEKMNQQLSENK